MATRRRFATRARLRGPAELWNRCWMDATARGTCARGLDDISDEVGYCAGPGCDFVCCYGGRVERRAGGVWGVRCVKEGVARVRGSEVEEGVAGVAARVRARGRRGWFRSQKRGCRILRARLCARAFCNGALEFICGSKTCNCDILLQRYSIGAAEGNALFCPMVREWDCKRRTTITTLQ